MTKEEIVILKFLEQQEFHLNNKGTTFLKTFLMKKLIPPFAVCVIYGEIALKHNSTSSKVEKALRHCINHSFYAGYSNSKVLAILTRDYHEFLLDYKEKV